MTEDQPLPTADHISRATRSIDATTAEVVDPVPSSPVTNTIPGYEILAELGRGGMGVVYKARQAGLNRIVAVKMLLGNPDSKGLVRFLAEADAMAAVDHPHVVQVFEYGDLDRQPFLVLEFLSGGSLADRLQTEHLTSQLAAEWVAKIATGVGAAHALGIVHRDLKPANILFDAADQPKVTDFGLAKRGTGSDLTRTAAIMGTPAYMAPEQAMGEGKYAGPPADVWALGVILYECLTGTRPFQGADHWALFRQILNDEPTPPRSHDPKIPRDLELICLKSLSKEAFDRYPTASAVADDLRRFLAGEPVSIRPAGRLERSLKWARRNPVRATAYGLAGSLLIMSLLVVAFGVLFAVAADESQRARSAEADASQQRRQAEAARDGESKAREAAESASAQLRIEKLATENARDGEQQARRSAEKSRDELAVEKAYAEAALTRESAALTEAQSARQKLDRVLNLQRLATAQQLHKDGKGYQGHHLLDTIPEPLRSWDWGYLSGLCLPRMSDPLEIATNQDFIAIPPPMHDAIISADGTIVVIYPGLTARMFPTPLNPRDLRVKNLQSGEFWQTTIKIADDELCVGIFPVSADAAIALIGSNRLSVIDPALGPVATLRGLQRFDLQTGSPIGPKVSLAKNQSIRILRTDAGDRFQPAVSSISPDGRFVLGQSATGQLVLYDTVTGGALREFVGLEGSAVAATFAVTLEGGLLVVALSNRRKVVAWKADDPAKPDRVIGAHPDADRLTSSPDGRWIVSSGRDGLRGWRTTGGMPRILPLEHPASVISFDRNAERLAIADTKFHIRVYDWESGVELAATSGTGSVEQMVFAPRERSLLLKHGGGPNIRRWGLNDFPRRMGAGNLSVTMGGNFSIIVEGDLVGGSSGGEVVIVDGKTGRLVRELPIVEMPKISTPVPGTAFSLPFAFLPGGRRLIVGVKDAVEIRDIASGKKEREYPSTSVIDALAVSPDGKRMAAADKTGRVAVWDADSGDVLATLRYRPRNANVDLFSQFSLPVSLAFDRTGRRLAAASGPAATAIVWDLDAKTELGRLGLPNSAVHEAGTRSFGAILGAVGNHAIDYQLGVGRVGYQSTTVRITPESFSPDGRYLVLPWEGRRTAKSVETNLVVWHLETGIKANVIPTFGDNANMAIFSPDGHRVLSASMQGIRVFDVTTGQHSLSIDGWTQWIGFDATGHQLRSVGNTGTFTTYSDTRDFLPPPRPGPPK